MYQQLHLFESLYVVQLAHSVKCRTPIILGLSPTGSGKLSDIYTSWWHIDGKFVLGGVNNFFHLFQQYLKTICQSYEPVYCTVVGAVWEPSTRVRADGQHVP